MTAFTYWGTELQTVSHLYNHTWANERAVELAVARHWMAERNDRRHGLEIGNVISHLWRCTHLVVDRYEQAAWYQKEIAQPYRNIDVLDVRGSFPWLLSISTIEHIGTDAPPDGRPEAALVALDHMRSLLRPGGSMLITFPTGVNPALDDYLLAGASGAERACTISRRDGFELWAQDDVPTVAAYGVASEHPYAGEWAEAVAVLEFSA